MKPIAAYRPLAASAIDLEDRTYFLSPGEDQPSRQLVSSIRAYGILAPPLVLGQEEGMHIVIAGWKRLKTAITLLNWEQVPCFVVPPGCANQDIYALILEQSLLGSPLSPAQQSTFLAKLCGCCDGEVTLQLLARMGYKPTSHQLDDLLALQELAKAALLALHHGTLNLVSAKKLLAHSLADQEALVMLISRLQLGCSKQLKLIELGTELLCREGGSMTEILAPFLASLETSRQNNIPQQAAALLSWLHEQCFPRSSRAKNEFDKKVAQLNLPAALNIEHTPSFEDDSVTLTLKFQDWQSLQEALPGVRQVLEEQSSAA